MGGPAPTELRLEFRDLTTNMGLHNGFSNTLRWSPMPGAALSTTLLDPLQRPSACNGNRLALRNASFEEDRQATPSTCLDPGPRSPCGPSKNANYDYDVLATTLDAPACDDSF